ncbi:MAG: nucleotidyltransferase family protein [Halioglobus sp.]
MAINDPTNWALFRILCRVLGGQDNHSLRDSIGAGLLPQLVELAQDQNVLPALAVRCGEQLTNNEVLDNPEGELLRQALRENTVRNMQICAQALKLTKKLNSVGISPLFLKGTVQLLTATTENLGFRKQVDIDLLVEPAQLEVAADAMLADGYCFYDFQGGAAVAPILIDNTRTAIKLSAAHHHLPPLVKSGYNTTVELHRHHLDKRFQRKNPLGPLFENAIPKVSRSANFLIPSPEYQMIHLVLGKLVLDGHLARRTFPLREACDFIDWQKTKQENIDYDLVTQHCGQNYRIFDQLVSKLMGNSTSSTTEQANISYRLLLMQKRYDSPGMAKILDAYSRATYLTQSLLFSPAKLPAYLRRLGTSQG